MSGENDQKKGERNREFRSVALLGLKHSGKSSVALSLAGRLSRPHVDTDCLLAGRAGCVSAREVYRAFGVQGFQGLEYEVCADIARHADEEDLIIATGGGLADNERALEALGGACELIYLRESEGVLYERFMENGHPAFLPDEEPRRAWARLYRRRDSCYRRWASCTIDCRGRTIDWITDTIAQRIVRPEGTT